MTSTTAKPAPATQTAISRKPRFGLIRSIAGKFHHLFTWSAVLLVIVWASLALYGWKPGRTGDAVFTGFIIVSMLFEIAKTMTTDELGKTAFIRDLATGLFEWSLVEAVIIIKIMKGTFDGGQMTIWAMLAFAMVEILIVIPNRFAIVSKQITAVDSHKPQHTHDHDPDTDGN